MTPVNTNPANDIPAPVPQMISEAEGEKEVGFFDLLMIAKRHWFLILMVFLFMMCLVFYMFITAENIYRSQAILYISSQNTQALISNAQFSQKGMDEKFLNTMVALLRNEEVLKSTWEVIRNDPEKSSLISDKVFDKGAVKWSSYVLSNLSIKLGGEGDIKKANVFQVAFTCPSSKEAFLVLRELIAQFQIYFKRQYEETTDVIGATIKQGREDLDRSIEKATNELSEYIRESKVNFIGDQKNNPLLTRLISLEGTVVTLDFQRLKYKNRYEMIQSLINGRNIADIPDAEIVTILGAGEETQSGGGMEQYLTTLCSLAQGGKMEESLNTTLLQLDLEQSTDMILEIAKLKEQNIGEENPRVQALRKAHEDLLKYRKEKTGIENSGGTVNKIGIFTYQEFLAAYIEILNDRIVALDRQRQEVQKYIDQQDVRVRQISTYCQKVESMRFSIDSQKEFYLLLDRKLDQVVLMRNYGGYQVEVISPPREELKPVSPNLVKHILIGIILGIFGGFGLAFASDSTDTTFRTPEEVQNALGIPLLAQLPQFSISKQSLNDLKADETGVPISSFIVYHFPNSPQCEVYRAIRTKLFFNPNVKCPQVVMCSSPHSGDGKTTFSSTLAILLANAGKRVLLVDGDIRKPDVHKKFNLKNKIGFADILAGHTKIEEAVLETQVKNLHIVTAGCYRKNPSGILTSARLDSAISRMKELYDIVIIDSSPILYVSDSCNIAPKTDGVIYIFRIRRRGQPEVVQGERMLADVGAPFLGCVVNCNEKHRFYDEFAVAKKRSYGSYGTGGGYGSGYGSGYGGGYGGGYGYGASYGTGSYGYGSNYGYGYGESYGINYGSKKYGDAAKYYSSSETGEENTDETNSEISETGNSENITPSED